jgi:hypothetical protein
LAGPGQTGTALIALEELHAEVGFQFLDGPRKWRLLDVQPLGRAGKVQLFSHGDEVTQMAEFHD